MSLVEKKLGEMGLRVPEAPQPVAAYIPGVRAGEFIFTSGQLPVIKGELKYKGKLGLVITEEEGYEAAKICALNCLGVIKSLIGDLDRIEQIVKVVGFVNSCEGFSRQPQVINGASELLANIFGEQGKHARSAVGVNELPLESCCEVEMIVRVK